MQSVSSLCKPADSAVDRLDDGKVVLTPLIPAIHLGVSSLETYGNQIILESSSTLSYLIEINLFKNYCW